MGAIQNIQMAPPNSVFANPVAKAQALIPILCELGDYNSAAFQVRALGYDPSQKMHSNPGYFISIPY